MPDFSFQVDLRVPAGAFTIEVCFETRTAFTGLFGPSGAGKTTLLESIAGLRREARGHIVLGERTLLDSKRRIHVPPEKRGIGYVAQDALLFPHRSVRENILFGESRAAANGSRRVPFERVLQVLELESLQHRNVQNLSGGEKQRVALARALCSGPSFLLLDEPFGSLDLPLRRRILPYLLRVRDEFHLPMMFVSHDATEVQALCDDLIVLQQGRLIAQGSPRSVLIDPRVYPMAERLDFENLMRGEIVAWDRGIAEVLLESGHRLKSALGDDTLSTPRGTAVLAGVRAEDIILATSQPQGLSARNILPATLVAIERGAGGATVAVSLAGKQPDVVAHIALPTIDALNLKPGQSIYLVIKARAVHLL